MVVYLNNDYLIAQNDKENSLTIHLVDSVLPIGLTKKICELRWEKLSLIEKNTIRKISFLKKCLRTDTTEGCDCCFDMYSGKVRIDPIITLKNIDSVDWEKQQYFINPNDYPLIRKGFVPKYGFTEYADTALVKFGIPCVLKIDNKPKYIIWFVLPGSSQGCDIVLAQFPKLNGGSVIMTKFGIPVANYVYGDDPRYNLEVLNTLKENKKLTQHNKAYK